MLRLISASWTPLLLLLALVGLVNSQALLGAANEATVAKSRISLEQTMLLQGANNNVNLLAVNETETDGTETTVATATLAPVISNATTLVPGGTATQAAATCPKTPDALLLVKRCRFFTEIMGVQPKSASSTSPAVIYPPRSLIVAVTVFCKVPDAEATFTDCVDETFATTSCSTPVKSQLHTIATDYWSRYCVNVDDNIQTLKYLFAKIPVHLVDEEWEVGATFTNQTGLCVNADDLQDLVINPCARWYNRVIGSGSRDRPLDVYLNVATTSSDIGLQCVKRRMLRSTNCGADLIYLMLRALYVFQGLPGVSIPLVYLDPSFKRQNPSPAGVCPPRHVVAIWSNQFVQSVNRGVRYCPLTAGATDLLTTDTVEIVGILNVDQGVTSIDIRFFNPTNQHDPLVWYKATNGQLPATFTSAVSRQSTITIEPVSGASIPTDTQVVKISDAGVGQMVIYVSVRSRQFYDVIVSATDFDFNYATGVLVHSCSRTEDIDYKTEVVSLESAKLTSQFADECEDACRSITTVGYHESCLIACMRRGGDSRIVNSINMLLGFTSELGRVCNITQYAPPIVISGASNPAVGSGFVLLASAIIATAAAALMV